MGLKEEEGSLLREGPRMLSLVKNQLRLDMCLLIGWFSSYLNLAVNFSVSTEEDNCCQKRRSKLILMYYMSEVHSEEHRGKDTNSTKKKEGKNTERQRRSPTFSLPEINFTSNCGI